MSNIINRIMSELSKKYLTNNQTVVSSSKIFNLKYQLNQKIKEVYVIHKSINNKY